jgi:predicted N-acetyltransferase YhbS
MSNEFYSRAVIKADLPAIQRLHDAVFGPGAFTRTAYRIREGMPAFTPFCRVVLNGEPIISSIRMTPITIGKRAGALMLGPLAVDPAYANQGYGRRLVRESLDAARDAGLSLVILVGDEAYYARLGFAAVQPIGRIMMPGPVDLKRILAAELKPGSLATYTGRIAAAPA